jgi:hypothetical protein
VSDENNLSFCAQVAMRSVAASSANKKIARHDGSWRAIYLLVKRAFGPFHNRFTLD